MICSACFSRSSTDPCAACVARDAAIQERRREARRRSKRAARARRKLPLTLCEACKAPTRIRIEGACYNCATARHARRQFRGCGVCQVLSYGFTRREAADGLACRWLGHALGENVIRCGPGTDFHRAYAAARWRWPHGAWTLVDFRTNEVHGAMGRRVAA